MTSSPATMTMLSFGLQGEIFAIDALMVREILDVVAITEVPNAPPFMSSLINVRGRVVPLADLRVMFGMTQTEDTHDTRIIVLEIMQGDEAVMIGILADRVYDVSDIQIANVEEAPRIGMRLKPELVRGIGKRGDDFIILPNMDQIFSLDSMAAETRHAA